MFAGLISLVNHGHNWWPIWLASTCFTMNNYKWEKKGLNMVGLSSETNWTMMDCDRPWSTTVKLLN